VYKKFPQTKKAKHFLLRNPVKTPRAGPSVRKTNKSSATVGELTSAITAVSVAVLGNGKRLVSKDKMHYLTGRGRCLMKGGD
jgi:hypothetical protein